ncbi:hypothetical protein EON65_27200 [archaeon]|nr:MAG: hypothetical protein EON65_27200 [archaeon]
MFRNFFSVVGKGGLAAGAAVGGTAAVAANEFSSGPPSSFLPSVEPFVIGNSSKGSSLESSTISIGKDWIVHVPSPLFNSWSSRTSESGDDISFASDSSTSILVESAYEGLNNEPLREEETDGAIATLRSRSELWRHVLPAHFSPEDIDSLFATVKSVTLDIGLIAEAKQNIECERKKRVEASMCTWAALQEKFPCAICRNVLAAPVALPCSHSYCGMCLNDLFSHCNEEDEVAHSCPCCFMVLMREQDTIYERAFDQTIEKEVERVADCEGKRDWQERRRTFQRLLKERENERKDEVKEEKEASQAWQQATAFLVFLLISLIVAARRL